jgi:D-sedoheptulose 7-phosphate isomerase
MNLNISEAQISLTETARVLLALDKDVLSKIAELLIELSMSENTLWTAGNGGSSSTASHMSCDVGKGIGMTHQKPFRCISINELAIAQSAWANDFGFDHAIKNQFEQLARPGDALLCISGSGNSENVVQAAKFAKSNGYPVVVLVGRNGGRLSEFSDIELRVDSTDMQVLENTHLAVVHWLYKALAQV